MKGFLVSDETSLSQRCYLSEGGRMFNFEEGAAHYEFGEAIYGHYLYGYDSEAGVKFVIHHHFEFVKGAKTVHLYMFNEGGEAVSEKLIRYISEILGVSPVFREVTDQYDGCHHELTWGHKAYRYIWVDDPEAGMDQLRTMLESRKKSGKTNETSEFLYQE